MTITNAPRIDINGAHVFHMLANPGWERKMLGVTWPVAEADKELDELRTRERQKYGR